MKFYTLLLVSGLLVFVDTPAEPYTPRNRQQVIARLPYKLIADSKLRELRQLREQLQHSPNQLEPALELAWHYVKLGRNEADPRYYGYAQAAVQPWWVRQNPPVEVLLLRATLYQNRHDFSAALSDLSQVLQHQPQNIQARLTQAVIQTVQGHYSDALRNCRYLARSTNRLLSRACFSHVHSLTGGAERNYPHLLLLYQTSTDVDPELHLWVLTLLADMAERLGYDEAAEQHYQQALKLEKRNQALLRAYSDFLLQHNRAQEVTTLLEQETRSDDLLLRLALAEKQLGSSQLQQHINSLQARFKANQLRGSSVHLGSESRFALALLNHPPRALTLAQQNWLIQKEPVDAYLLVTAALEAKHPQTLQMVKNWVNQHQWEDVRLQRLLDTE